MGMLQAGNGQCERSSSESCKAIIEGKELAAFLAQMSHGQDNSNLRELSGGREYYGGHTGPWTDANGKTYTTKYHGRLYSTYP